MNVEEIIKTSKLIPPESRTVIHLSLVNQKISHDFTHALKPFGVSPEQFNVLRILRGRYGKPANLNDLNERMVTKMSNTSRLVDKLLIKGYADRTTCPENRRKINIIITEKGRETLKLMDETIRNTERALLKGFTREALQELNTLLDKF